MEDIRIDQYGDELYSALRERRMVEPSSTVISERGLTSR